MQARRDPAFDAEFRSELAHYVGRPSPIYHARRWSERLGGAQIYFKREDLNHTGATPATEFGGHTVAVIDHEQAILLQMQVRKYRMANDLRGYQTPGGVCVDLAAVRFPAARAASVNALIRPW